MVLHLLTHALIKVTNDIASISFSYIKSSDLTSAPFETI